MKQVFLFVVMAVFGVSFVAQATDVPAKDEPAKVEAKADVKVEKTEAKADKKDEAAKPVAKADKKDAAAKADAAPAEKAAK